MNTLLPVNFNTRSWKNISKDNSHISNDIFKILEQKYIPFKGDVDLITINPVIGYLCNRDAKKHMYNHPDFLLLENYSLISERYVYGPITYRSFKYTKKLLTLTISPKLYCADEVFNIYDDESGILFCRPNDCISATPKSVW